MQQLQTPFCDAIDKILKEKPTRFFMPGHKGNAAVMPRFGGALYYDITEIEGADDLSHPSGPLAQSQANMARVFGAGATLYSAAGSTSCILARFTLFLRPGQKVVMARSCHNAAVRALALIDLYPVWVLPQSGMPTAAKIEAALGQSGAAAVYITSPDYYGRLADVEAIAAVCRAHGVPLLVDNAHGPHLRFVTPQCHPLALGADACADSAHKTMPCLTPAALLHLRNASLQGSARSALNLYSSTSPSYLVLQTLDYTAGLLLANAIDFDTAAAKLAETAEGFAHIVQPGGDPLKLCLVPAKGGWPYADVLAALRNAGVEPEMADGAHIVLMASPCNTDEDFARLHGALAPFAAQRSPLPLLQGGLALPQAACTVRQAVFGVKETVPVQQAAGRIAASAAAPCPPGIPVVVPGEVVPAEAVPLLLAGGFLQLDVLK
jgi:arginine/lysine/ornithine decarboxylase